MLRSINTHRLQQIFQLVILFSLFILLSTEGVSAQIMYMLDNQNEQLLTLDVNTLTTQIIGPTGVGVMNSGIAFSPDGSLYAMNIPSGSTANLYTVDTSTGAFTYQYGLGASFSAFEIDPLSGTGLLWQPLIGVSAGQVLFTVDLATGLTTRIDDSKGIVAKNLAYSPDGTLYTVNYDFFPDTLYEINLSPYGLVAIGDLYPTPNPNLSSHNLAYNPDDGFLYSLTHGSGVSELYSIDPSTGAASYVGDVTLPSGAVISSTTFSPSVVPEPVSSTLFLVGAGSLGFRQWRNRKAA